MRRLPTITSYLAPRTLQIYSQLTAPSAFAWLWWKHR